MTDADPGLASGLAPSRGRLIVHAPNVHIGGGAVLLTALLEAYRNTRRIVLLVDRRMPIAPVLEEVVEVHRIEPRVASRLAAEKKLRDLSSADDIVLAFGNLPPIYRLRAQTVLFVQNRYLIDPSMSLSGFGLGTRLRLAVERLWLKNRIGNADRVIVQTSSMAALFETAFGRKAEVAAFDPMKGREEDRPAESRKQFDFIYVSSGEPHKNHRALIDAFALLADGGVTPSLALTLSGERSRDIIALAEDANARRGTRIVNLDRLTPDGIPSAYRSAHALIFPSFAESFGLPLLEAAQFGLPIVASELDYVRDLVAPAETFDPRSVRSIARAVRRFLKLPADHDLRVDAAGFLHQVCGAGR